MTPEYIKKIAEKNAHIPDDTLENDIKDTEVEIVQMEREATGFDLLGDRLSVWKADGRRSGIEERKKFIERLQAILDYRNNTIQDCMGQIKEI